ncbi:hypothetical protein KAFR_0H02370 [Kazachstania africana CBS 2517]|uniref:Vacuolar membrane protein n=1 Tax=Kazachstania africana (strain ATCC 22294 / BCRC 22015 / CBS 2517 / CECT 1963 / NBRC 1671 / NRRL Y-8276) TaxID=1071382 RepID=H2AZ90_KAZAF|nr:hypothetical protein KAFR_0H02370 [Kazachstania africana CBS 2517]CCF59646.1 hypothetical protein KAFR_0H02370 [Kazachstania africana CBS 2517]
MGSTKQGTCKLLGPVSLCIQLLMGLLVVAVLLLKRNYEYPRRKLIVWTYDTTKQIGGSFVIHVLNLGISILKKQNLLVRSGGSKDNNEQCDWYFLNLLMDTTVGIPILWFSLHFVEKTLSIFNVKNIESGNYFSRHKIHHRQNKNSSNDDEHPLFVAFCKQFVVFICGLCMMKFAIFIILNYYEQLAEWFADIVLSWADPWPNFQVFLIMFVFPILLNCFQYCCVDNIIKLHSLNLGNLNNFEPNTFIAGGDEEDLIWDQSTDSVCSSYHTQQAKDTARYGSTS